MNKTLLKLQIGPVQDFIAQARSTRDLWSGSYLLSWLATAGLCKLVRQLVKPGQSPKEAVRYVIFPNLQDQPLFDLQLDGGHRGIHPPDACLTPNVPNLFVAALPADINTANQIAREVEEAIRFEWKQIADSCWQELLHGHLVSCEIQRRFDHQTANFLSISWQCTPWDSDYKISYEKNGRQLDAVRQTRVFHGWSSGRWRRGGDMNKDSLTGREEAICGGNEWWREHIKVLEESDPECYSYWRTVFRERHSGDSYGAVTLVKRLWHRVYLSKEENGAFEVAKQLPIPSTYQAANHDPRKDGDDERDDLPDDAQRYFALLAMDGDRMGEWLSGDKALEMAPDAHRGFSTALSGFALRRARAIVSSPQHQGCLIYTGGDDVLALLPADTALACARSLREEFRAYVKGQIQFDCLHAGQTMEELEASVGIAIAHFKEPLQDVVRAAQAAERRAKNELDRAAFSVTLIKHSGETVQWGCKWEMGLDKARRPAGSDLYQTILDGIRSGVFSSRFPHHLAETLALYLPAEKGGPQSARAFQDEVDEIIAKEFAVVLNRQRGCAGDLERHQFLEQRQPEKQLRTYLASLDGGDDPAATKIRAMIGLCQTVAFAVRNEVDAPKPSQPAPPPTTKTI